MDRISLKSPVSMRENYVDIIKGFAIIAVVLLHINFAFPKYALINIGKFFCSVNRAAVMMSLEC